MTSPVFDIEVRAFDRASGVRLPLNPKVVLSGVTWSYVERGGAEMATIPIAAPFDQIPVANGDYVEIWALNTGENVPRWRGVVNAPERSLQTTEKHTITAYGRMEDMSHVVIDAVIVQPFSLVNGGVVQGADIVSYAAKVFADYVGRLSQASVAYAPWKSFSTDFAINQYVGTPGLTGVNMIQLDATLTSARAAMDALADQAGTGVVWGWDIDPVTGNDRFYVRARQTAVGEQFYIGVGVQEITAPMEFQAVTNSAWVKGGPATYPNLFTNPSFEVPVPPSTNDGDLLNDGGFETFGGWIYGGGAQIYAYDPSVNHNHSAHTGKFCLNLDNSGKSAYQTIPLPTASGSANPEPYICSLYAARENDGYANNGLLTINGLNASGAVLESYSLPITPPSILWTGGADSTILGNTTISLPVTFISSTITQAKIALTTSNGTAGSGLLIDDVVFTSISGVGSFGWGTHYELPGSSLNLFGSIDWASEAAAWEGAYGVRANVLAASPSARPALAPNPQPGVLAGGLEFSLPGYQMRPTPQMTLRCGFRVRMSPGIAIGSGSVYVEYRSHRGDGNQNQYQDQNFSVPNDGNWHFCFMDVGVHGDTTIAVSQCTFAAPGWYDVDGFTARDAGADEGGDLNGGVNPTTAGYLRGTDFECYINASDPRLTPYVSAASSSSIANYGLRDGVINNKNIVGIDTNTLQWLGTWFNTFAVALGRTRVRLVDEQTQTPDPGTAALIRVSGTSNDIADQYSTKTTYSWTGKLGIDVELTTQRPTLSKLLLSAAGASAGSSGASATSAALSQASQGTPSSGGSTNIQPITDTFSPNGSASEFTLSQTPKNAYVNAYVMPDGLKYPQSSFASVAGNMVTFNFPPRAGINTLEIEYFYNAST